MDNESIYTKVREAMNKDFNEALQKELSDEKFSEELKRNGWLYGTSLKKMKNMYNEGALCIARFIDKEELDISVNMVEDPDKGDVMGVEQKIEKVVWLSKIEKHHAKKIIQCCNDEVDKDKIHIEIGASKEVTESIMNKLRKKGIIN